MQLVAFKAGDTIIAEGDDGDTAFLIVTGSVDVSIGQGKKARTLVVRRNDCQRHSRLPSRIKKGQNKAA